MMYMYCTCTCINNTTKRLLNGLSSHITTHLHMHACMLSCVIEEIEVTWYLSFSVCTDFAWIVAVAGSIIEILVHDL